MEPGLTHRQWPRLIGHTHPFEVAADYVFVKQSGPPCHCDLPLERQAPLLPKIRGQFAEFPGLAYPAGLRLLGEGTCVGFRYGHSLSPEGPFQGIQESGDPATRAKRIRRVLVITTLPLLLRSDSATALLALSRTVRPSFSSKLWRRNINRLPFRGFGR